MVAQPTGMNPLRHKRTAERVHLNQRREVRGVAIVVRIDALGERRAGRRLDSYHPYVALAAQLRPDERERDTGEVRPAPGTPDHNIGIVVCHLELGQRFLADHRLMQQHMIEHAPERVFCVACQSCNLDSLADRNAQTAGTLRMLLQDHASGLRLLARTGDDTRAIGLHQRPPVRLLMVADLHHEHQHLEPEQGTGKRQRRAPLPRAGLGRQALYTGLPVVISLRHRGIRLMAPRRADALIFVVNFGRRIQDLLQPPRPIQGRWSPLAVDRLHRLGDRDQALPADLLQNQLHRKQRLKVRRPEGLPGAGMQRRRQGDRQVGLNVVPRCRHPIFS